MKVKVQGPSLARAPCMALGGALNKYSVYTSVLFVILYSFRNEDPKILQASGPTKPESALGVNEILVALRRGFS